MSRAVSTKKGYDLFEVVSALQKSIRRGLEKEALYWAYELHTSGFHAYLWKRLLVISVEDVGAANPDIIPQVRACKDNYYDLDKGILPLAGAVSLMCRSPKSRLFDWQVCWMMANHSHVNLKIPDFALDKHTRRGKIKGRGMDHFIQEGTKLSPHEIQKDEEWYRDEFLEVCDVEGNMNALPSGNPDRLMGPKEEQEELPIPDEEPQPRRRVRQRTVSKPEGQESGKMVF